MKRLSLIVPLLAVVLFATSCFSQNEKDSKVHWMNVQEAVNKAEQDGKGAKLIFIDCYTSWCGWCKVLDQKSFQNDTVAAILNYYYYPCKFDAEGGETVKINGITYNPADKQERGKTHELMKLIWEGQRSGGYPSMAIRKSDFRSLDCIMGFVGPEDLQVILVYYAEEFNKEMSFEKFQKLYAEKYRKDILKKIFKK